MAIAQIAQESDFERNCMAARNVEELRHIILLSSRRREAKQSQIMGENTE